MFNDFVDQKKIDHNRPVAWAHKCSLFLQIIGLAEFLENGTEIVGLT